MLQRLVEESVSGDYVGEEGGVYGVSMLWDRLPMVLVTGCGFPDVATRALVRVLVLKYGLEPYMLVDYNPAGLRVLLCYEEALGEEGGRTVKKRRKGLEGTKDGGKEGTQQPLSLSPTRVTSTTPRIKWLGLHSSDFFSEKGYGSQTSVKNGKPSKSGLENACRVRHLKKPSARDYQLIHGLLSDDRVPDSWRKEIATHMIEYKAELQSLYEDEDETVTNSGAFDKSSDAGAKGRPPRQTLTRYVENKILRHQALT